MKTTAGRKSRFPGKTVRQTWKLRPDTLAAVLRLAGQLTERDRYPCTPADAAAYAIHRVTRTPMPATTLHRKTKREATA